MKGYVCVQAVTVIRNLLHNNLIFGTERQNLQRDLVVGNDENLR